MTPKEYADKFADEYWGKGIHPIEHGQCMREKLEKLFEEAKREWEKNNKES